MQYSVPATFVIEADNAAAAEAKLGDMLVKKDVQGFTVHSASGYTTDKPALSNELRTFLDAEIQNNDDDTSGHETDLDYVRGTLEQMPPENVVEQAIYVGDLEDEQFVEQFTNEFNALYARYGGGTIVADLLPDD